MADTKELRDFGIQILTIGYLTQGQAKRFSELIANACERIEELEAKNEQLEKWQIKPTEAICLTDLTCRYQKVFKND